MSSILLVDDDERVLTSLARVLRGDGHDVRAAGDATSALSRIAEAEPDLVLSDVRMQEIDGLALLRVLKERAPRVPVVLMTAYGDLPTVSAAMREGATDFLVKPLDARQLRSVVRSALDERRAQPPSQPEDAPQGTLLGRDPAMLELFKAIGRLASSRATVLIRGESGTGKELIARALHEGSEWSSEPFIAINCTAVPATLLESELFGHTRGSFTGATADRRGRFELAGRGSIFLDEIGDTSLDFQAKLLRVLQEREYLPVGAERAVRTEARVIAATHRNLEKLVERGRFREDLYYRLRVVELHVPPLRERAGDIRLLAEQLIKRAANAAGRPIPALTDDALEQLLAYRWPGNVRELENTLTRAVVLAPGDVLRREHLGLDPARLHGGARSLDNAMRDHIVAVLASTGGRKARAARILGISRPRLDRLIERYRIGHPRSGDDA